MTSIQLKLKVVVGVCNIRVRNHQTFQNLCAESSKVRVRNHQDNNFLINVAYRCDANLINGHGSYFEGEDSTSSKFIHPVS